MAIRWPFTLVVIRVGGVGGLSRIRLWEIGLSSVMGVLIVSVLPGACSAHVLLGNRRVQFLPRPATVVG